MEDEQKLYFKVPDIVGFNNYLKMIPAKECEGQTLLDTYKQYCIWKQLDELQRIQRNNG